MAKGQMRSNREKKKPKSSTKNQKPSATPAANNPFPTKADPQGKKR